MRHTSQKKRSLSAAAAADPWVGIQETRDKAVQVWGTFTATWKLQAKITLDADYLDLVTGKTGPDIVEITAPVVAVRVVCTAYTSGTIEANFAGFNSRTE